MGAGRPVGIAIIGAAHIVFGGLACVTQLVVIVLTIAEGLQLFSLMALVLAAVLGPGVGLALLRGRPWAWYVASLLYLLVAGSGLLTASWLLRGLAPENVLGIAMLWFSALVALALYAYLFFAGVRTHFGFEGGARTVLALEVTGLVVVVAAAGVWTTRNARSIADDEQAAVRLPLIQDIGERGGRATDADLALMLEGLESRNFEERLTAAWALGRTGRNESFDRLAEVARDDRDVNVRINAIAGVAELGSVAAQPVLVELLSDSDPQVAQAALRGLADEAFAGAAPEVADVLADASVEVRSMAVDVLGEMANPAALQILVEACGDAESDIRSRAAFALGKLGEPSAVGALARLLEDETWEVRANAAQALGMIGSPEARGPLGQAAEDPNAYVREAARASLQKLP